MLLLQANFARSNAAQSKAQATRVPRFLPNPEQHWGPKPKAGRRIGPQHASLIGQAAVNSTPSASKPPAEVAADAGSGKAEGIKIPQSDGKEEEPPAAKRQKTEGDLGAVAGSS